MTWAWLLLSCAVVARHGRYNLGAAGIASFTTFKSLIEAHSWSAAANDLKGTLWCSQVRAWLVRCPCCRGWFVAGVSLFVGGFVAGVSLFVCGFVAGW